MLTGATASGTQDRLWNHPLSSRQKRSFAPRSAVATGLSVTSMAVADGGLFPSADLPTGLA